VTGGATTASSGDRAEEGRPVKVALYSGIVVARDAVSWSLVHKLEALRRLQAQGAPIEVTVFTQSIDEPAPEFVVCPSVAKLLGRPEFWEADVHIYEEGMYYELFDSIYLVASDRPILAIEHNSTPVELVDVPAARLAVERSHAQRRNLILASHVACVSELNVEMARSAGVDDAAISVLHLPPAIVPTRPPQPLSGHSGPVRLLYLGRFVRAKGVADMLELVRRLVASGDGRFEVTLAGDPRFSDPGLMGEMEEARLAGRLQVVLAPDDRAMAELFEATDVLVIPSYHEGYCVPVVEAFGFGRFVVAYDSGNLANIVDGLGTVVPTGDVDAMETAVLEVAHALERSRGGAPLVLPTGRGEMADADWRRAVGAHLRDYSAANFERRFLGLLADLVGASPAGLDARVAEAISARLVELADVE